MVQTHMPTSRGSVGVQDVKELQASSLTSASTSHLARQQAAAGDCMHPHPGFWPPVRTRCLTTTRRPDRCRSCLPLNGHALPASCTHFPSNNLHLLACQQEAMCVRSDFHPVTGSGVAVKHICVGRRGGLRGGGVLCWRSRATVIGRFAESSTWTHGGAKTIPMLDGAREVNGPKKQHGVDVKDPLFAYLPHASGRTTCCGARRIDDPHTSATLVTLIDSVPLLDMATQRSRWKVKRHPSNVFSNVASLAVYMGPTDVDQPCGGSAFAAKVIGNVAGIHWRRSLGVAGRCWRGGRSWAKEEWREEKEVGWVFWSAWVSWKKHTHVDNFSLVKLFRHSTHVETSQKRATTCSGQFKQSSVCFLYTDTHSHAHFSAFLHQTHSAHFSTFHGFRQVWQIIPSSLQLAVAFVRRTSTSTPTTWLSTFYVGPSSVCWANSHCARIRAKCLAVWRYTSHPQVMNPTCSMPTQTWIRAEQGLFQQWIWHMTMKTQILTSDIPLQLPTSAKLPLNDSALATHSPAGGDLVRNVHSLQPIPHQSGVNPWYYSIPWHALNKLFK